MGQVYIWDEETKSVLPREEVMERRARAQFGKGGTIIKDIEPYRNVIDGGVITSRKHHRDFLRARNMIEVGNETKHVRPKPFEPDAAGIRSAIKESHERLSSGEQAPRPRYTTYEWDKAFD